MKKIIYILSGNLSTTPRALQSIKTAMQFFDVEILAINRSNTWKEIDNILVKENGLNYNTVSLKRKPFLNWFTGSIVNKISKIVYPFFSKNINITSYASAKTMFLLKKELFKSKNKYDLIIAHSYSSLYPAYKFAKRTNTKFTFDIEDYHPGEAVGFDTSNEKARRVFLMQKLLPEASFITYASPLIGEYSLKLLKNYPEDKHKLINNCFSETEFQFKENKSEKVKFVWFSQNISQGRGLELVVPALEKFKDKIELHLIGNLYHDFYDNFLKKYSGFITTHKPLPQKELNLKLSDFDVGLAIELNTADFNRQLCLTNKIWAYTQSGLFVLATDTHAQIKFIEEHKNVGLISKQDNASFENYINKIIVDIPEIRNNKQNSFNYAKKLSWENESEKLIAIWVKTLK